MDAICFEIGIPNFSPFEDRKLLCQARAELPMGNHGLWRLFWDEAELSMQGECLTSGTLVKMAREGERGYSQSTAFAFSWVGR
jgi:hypothetical protein